jgi:hypothetical protein
LPKLILKHHRGKEAKNVGNFVFVVKKLPKVNNHPMDEFSPNLVTLVTR